MVDLKSAAAEAAAGLEGTENNKPQVENIEPKSKLQQILEQTEEHKSGASRGSR